MKDDVRSLSHSKWRCKYHIVFAPKYRRQIIYKQLKADIGKILRELCERKGVEIIEAECCPDHIHMLVAIPPHLSVAGFMGYLKSKSSLMIFDRHANLKYKYGNRHFWCRGYYVDTVELNSLRDHRSHCWDIGYCILGIGGTLFRLQFHGFRRVQQPVGHA